ncbi:MAG: aldehyde dehydrogenase family protein [Armatimonadota bacterium]|nr:aldehyde dehydrogenase family protein [Armatimonadota bacterium]
MAVETVTKPKEYQYLVGGKWISSGEKLEVRSPYSHDVAAVIEMATKKDVDNIIDSSLEGFAIMKKTPSYKRAEMLHGIAQRIRDRKEELARAMTLESGKPIKDSRAEIDRAVMTFTIASEEAKRIPGEAIPMDLNAASEGRFGVIRRFPIGPILGITPFNFPLNLVAHKVAPALASGNSIIIKPSTRTPVSSLLLGEIALDAGVPAGALNVVPCSNDVTQMFVADDRIKMITFTGGTEVGWDIKGKSGRKRVTLELGGNAAAIIDKGSDIDYALKRTVVGAFYYAGQSCISVQRMYIHRSVYDEFLDRYLIEVKKLKVGDPLDEATDVGPVIDMDAADRVEEWISEAINHGAKLLTGGKRSGQIFEPTVLENVSPDVKVACREAFAPLVAVQSFDKFEDAVRMVNDSEYGLQAGVFTNNLRNIVYAYNELEVGQVIINDAPTYRIDHMPYGGVKASGFGREGIRYSIEEMTEIKLLAVNVL